MARSKKLPDTIARAIKSGHVPVLRDWRTLPTAKMTQGEKVCAFIERYVPTPEGPMVGKPMQLLPFQEAFIQAIFDGDIRARRAILSVGRKAGKTAVTASLMIAFMFMEGLCSRNSRINSAALSRDQAALVFNYMSKSILLSPTLSAISKITPSGKRIIALSTGIEYHALAAEAGKAMGLSPAVLCGDEWGQVVGATHPFIDALLSSQGAHTSPLSIIISTQAPSDADWLSLAIDDATRNPTPEIVCHCYTADESLDIEDQRGWEQACPAIGVFRSLDDVKMQAEQAKRLPVTQASFENLILNRRVALDNLWLAPAVWRENGAHPDPAIFSDGRVVAMGLDLSQKTDLTAAVLAAQDDDGVIHLIPFAFTPQEGIAERELKSRAPYQAWVRDGQLIAVPGKTVDYEWVFGWLRRRLDDMNVRVDIVAFDRWRITQAQGDAERAGFVVPTWQEVGQGYQSMSPRIEHMETLLLQGKVRHGLHPLLNLGAASAIVVSDAAGNKKLDKSKATQKIDVLVASVMAMGVFMEQPQEFNVEALIG